MKNIILASGSPRRKELLEQIGIEFTIEVGRGKEVTSRTKPDEVVKELSYQKAREIYDKNKDAIIIGADTVVCVDDRILGKPASADNWREMIKSIQGRKHYVYTGVTVLWRSDDGLTHVLSFHEATGVYVHSMTDGEIEDYIATGEAYDKAGGYGIQGSFAKYIYRIDGDYNNVVGLPVSRLYQELKKSRIL